MKLKKDDPYANIYLPFIPESESFLLRNKPVEEVFEIERVPDRPHRKFVDGVRTTAQVEIKKKIIVVTDKYTHLQGIGSRSEAPHHDDFEDFKLPENKAVFVLGTETVPNPDLLGAELFGQVDDADMEEISGALSQRETRADISSSKELEFYPVSIRRSHSKQIEPSDYYKS
mmetsp:Transcript_6667/g.10717  ORF Transcript_6667/g.10717 Transcript_6667/m.10717 type:complete len:172 (-) Transcript_6667:19-534(-)